MAVTYARFGLREMFLGGVRSLEELRSRLTVKGSEAKIDARDLVHKEINDLIREAALGGARKITLYNVCGQRYIGTRLFLPEREDKIEIHVYSTPGNDLGAFLSGHRIVVHGNAQDGVGNTMDDGEIVVHGRAGDIVGMSMRGGKVFIRDSVGYRAAIHMKEYTGKVPVLVIGGTAQDFFGEYMAGGVVILLGLNLQPGERHHAHYMGTGMHGGVIYLRGEVAPYQLGKEVGVLELDDSDRRVLERHVGEFAAHFGQDAAGILDARFVKLLPVSKRPYGRIYAY
ncbi:MAG TPA: hypothetical protein GXX25_10060 [Desulfotomaculum sp.]|nr:hypothetical protein [Desulfotomaculum sp.]